MARAVSGAGAAEPGYEPRDLDAKPYSADELRVGEYLLSLDCPGLGDDPVGFLIASHGYVLGLQEPGPGSWRRLVVNLKTAETRCGALECEIGRWKEAEAVYSSALNDLSFCAQAAETRCTNAERERDHYHKLFSETSGEYDLESDRADALAAKCEALIQERDQAIADADNDRSHLKAAKLGKVAAQGEIDTLAAHLVTREKCSDAWEAKCDALQRSVHDLESMVNAEEARCQAANIRCEALTTALIHIRPVVENMDFTMKTADADALREKHLAVIDAALALSGLGS